MADVSKSCSECKLLGRAEFQLSQLKALSDDMAEALTVLVQAGQDKCPYGHKPHGYYCFSCHKESICGTWQAAKALKEYQMLVEGHEWRIAADLDYPRLLSVVCEAIEGLEDGLLWDGGPCDEEPESPIDCRTCGMRGCGWAVHQCRVAARKLKECLKVQEGEDDDQANA